MYQKHSKVNSCEVVVFFSLSWALVTSIKVLKIVERGVVQHGPAKLWVCDERPLSPWLGPGLSLRRQQPPWWS